MISTLKIIMVKNTMVIDLHVPSPYSINNLFIIASRDIKPAGRVRSPWKLIPRNFVSFNFYWVPSARLKAINQALSKEEAVSWSLLIANEDQLQQRDCVVVKVDAAFKEGWSYLAGVASLDE